ncbi:MAG: YjbF family lipoprotein [Cypionkella sp.]
MKMTLRSHFRITGLLVCCSILAGCGTTPEAGETKATLSAFKAIGAAIGGLGRKQSATKPDAATLASFRQILVQVGKPIYSVTIKKSGYANMMTPYGSNGNVQTWASGAQETISLNDGVLVATRGFGADIMTSVAPDLSQIRNAVGGFHRVYYYLDGADQDQSLGFDCRFEATGTETVSVVGKPYATHRVTEDCASPHSEFKNVYWFDGSGKLRQSDQFVSPELATMRLQRVID